MSLKFQDHLENIFHLFYNLYFVWFIFLTSFFRLLGSTSLFGLLLNFSIVAILGFTLFRQHVLKENIYYKK